MIHLHPVQTADRDFLYQVYASTREEEMRQVDWSPEQVQAFLRQQFEAQDFHYRQHYTTAQFYVIKRDDEAVGRLYVDYWEKEIRVIDIAMLPAYRGQGIGQHLMQQLMADARQKGLKVSIHVEIFNRALSFYRRLGFREVSTYGMYYLMEWVPDDL